MIIGILSIGFGILISQNYKSIGKAVIVDDKFMTLVGSLGNVANGLSRPMWSTLNDKYSFKFLMTIILISEVILALTLQLSFSN